MASSTPVSAVTGNTAVTRSPGNWSSRSVRSLVSPAVSSSEASGQPDRNTIAAYDGLWRYPGTMTGDTTWTVRASALVFATERARSGSAVPAVA